MIRPFLEKWQASYRHWWQQEPQHLLEASPFERQRGYPRLEGMLLADWRLVRRFCHDAAKELTKRFKLPDVMAVAPLGFKQQWLAETDALTEGVAEGDARRGPGKDRYFNGDKPLNMKETENGDFPFPYIKAINWNRRVVICANRAFSRPYSSV